MHEAEVFLGIDLGGTALRASVLRTDGSVITSTRRDLAVSPVEKVRAVLEIAAAHRGVVGGIGLAVAGTVRDGALSWSANLGLADVPFASLVADATGLPVAVLNDARAAGLAEARLGAGAGRDLVAMITVGTGIGGALVLRGQLVTGTGDAGEVGHMRLAPRGPVCGCGRRGCWETLAGGLALERAAARVLPPGVPATAATLATAAEAGDPVAIDVIERAARQFGRGIDTLGAVLAPDVIVLGGGVMARDGVVARAYRSAVSQLRWVAPTSVVPAALGDLAGQIGAALAAASA